MFILSVAVAHAQFDNPVKWSYSAKKIADKTYELHLTANIDNKWHVYGQDAGDLPAATSFSFTANPLVKLEGKVKELGKLEEVYDPNIKTTLKYYSKQVDFVQKIKLRSAANTLVNGVLSYVVCDDKKCLPPTDIAFSIKVTGK